MLILNLLQALYSLLENIWHVIGKTWMNDKTISP